ncbi:hypothetical protein [Streptomyces cylindrosporus]|uniref:NACHT domain-containing protein n=1 Tax=Streptomyces cylindrosporus TaxID=2927583 RepID=A0ABS9YHV0_9ACTN|nr:hypothetical protein [Streptomyces cylindrosporus]MCI3276115.1 hypothetical protein [Streptomyces cylindrosporus]
MEARGERSVSAGGNIGTAITGDHNTVMLAPPVRSAYQEQVRRIAPAELIDRERELNDLAVFCTAASGPSYTWWRAGAWAGKTALMSWFALHPPQGVRIVPFFVTARLGAQNDVVAYVDVVLEQLAELADEGIPAHLTQATREAHLLRLYGEAARACRARGERLVLLVDGLDEDRGVTTGPDAHSIASLLPARPEEGMRVLVAGRLNPPLPGDVPGGHPLHDPAIVRTLPRSPYAEAIRTEAERELKHLIKAGGLEYDLLALVTAAGGGLTADDLAELTEAVPYRVRDVLRTRAGRTFGLRVHVYLLGHEELQTQAEEMLGAAELDRYRGKLHDWADAWRQRGRPDRTPDYLLRGYFRMLRATRNLPRMTDWALDAVRHDRMLEATGGDVAALAEIRTTEDLAIETGAVDLPSVVRLALRREELEGRNHTITRTFPRAWATLGRPGRAEALARGIPRPEARLLALTDVAEVLLDRGDREDALRLLAEVDREAPLGDRGELGKAVIVAWQHAGELDRAERRVRAVSDPKAREWLLPDLALRWARSGAFDRAEALCLEEETASVRARGAGVVAAAWVEADRLDRAEALVRAAGPEAELVVWAWIVDALRRAGRDGAARELLARLDFAACPPHLMRPAAEALTAAGEYDRVVALTPTPWEDGGWDDWEEREWGEALCRVASALADDGEFTRAWSLVARNDDEDWRFRALGAVAKAQAASGAYEEIERRIGESGERQRGWLRYAIVEASTEAGELDRAERMAADGEGELFHEEMLELVIEARARAGAFVRSMELARSLGWTSAYEALVRGVLAAEASGTDAAADAIAEAEAECRRSGRTGSLDAAFTACDLAEAGWRQEAEAVLDALGVPVGPEAETGQSTPEAEHPVRPAGAENIAAALSRTGRFDEAEALFSGLRDSFLYEGLMASHVRRLCVAGQFDRAVGLVEPWTDVGDRLRMEIATHAAAAGEKELARSLAAETSDSKYRVRSWARIAVSLAARGDEEAAAALAEAESQHGTRRADRWATADLMQAYFALGRSAAGERLLSTMAPVRPSDFTGYVVTALVQVGEYDRAEDWVERLVSGEDTGRLALVEGLVAAGQQARAVQLTRRIEESGADPDPRLWLALAPGLEPDRARVLVARAAQRMRLQQVLPALVRVEPRTVSLIVETLCRPAPATPPTAARTSARSET